MTIYDHDAIRKAYPDAVVINNDTGVFKEDGTKIEVEQSKIDEARTTIDSEYAALEYSRNRAAEYPSLVDQLDDIYHNGVASWKTTIKAIKDKYPKPS